MGNCFSGIFHLLQQSVKQKTAKLADKEYRRPEKILETTTVRLRRLDLADAAPMIALEMACFPEIVSGQPGIHFVTETYYFTLGAFVDGRMVGSVTSMQRWRCQRQPSRKEDRRVLRDFHRPSYIANLAVLGCAQGRGIATTLLKVIIERERREGADSVYLHVMATNKKALRLYEKLGFVRTGFIENYYGQETKGAITDAIVCVRSF